MKIYQTNKSFLIFFIITVTILISGCSTKQQTNKKASSKDQVQKSKKTKAKINNSTNIQNTKKDSGALETVKSYLDMLSKNQTEEANALVINKKYTFVTEQGDYLTISPNNDNPFSYIRIKSFDESTASINNPQVEVYTYTIVADIKWPGNENLVQDYAFFINALKEDGKWKVSGISIEF